MVYYLYIFKWLVYIELYSNILSGSPSCISFVYRFPWHESWHTLWIGSLSGISFVNRIPWHESWPTLCLVPYLVFLWDIPSSTQQTLVFWSPISTIQALLTPDPKDAQTDSYRYKTTMSTNFPGICIKMHITNFVLVIVSIIL